MELAYESYASLSSFITWFSNPPQEGYQWRHAVNWTPVYIATAITSLVSRTNIKSFNSIWGVIVLFTSPLCIGNTTGVLFYWILKVFISFSKTIIIVLRLLWRYVKHSYSFHRYTFSQQCPTKNHCSRMCVFKRRNLCTQYLHMYWRIRRSELFK